MRDASLRRTTLALQQRATLTRERSVDKGVIHATAHDMAQQLRRRCADGLPLRSDAVQPPSACSSENLWSVTASPLGCSSACQVATRANGARAESVAWVPVPVETD